MLLVMLLIRRHLQTTDPAHWKNEDPTNDYSESDPMSQNFMIVSLKKKYLPVDKHLCDEFMMLSLWCCGWTRFYLGIRQNIYSIRIRGPEQCRSGPATLVI